MLESLVGCETPPAFVAFAPPADTVDIFAAVGDLEIIPAAIRASQSSYIPLELTVSGEMRSKSENITHIDLIFRIF